MTLLNLNEWKFRYYQRSQIPDREVQQFAQGKKGCTVCRFVVKADRHIERCNVKTSAVVTSLMRDVSWIGDAMCTLDTRGILLSRGFPDTAIASHYTSGRFQHQWGVKHGYVPDGLSEKEGSARFEVSYAESEDMRDHWKRFMWAEKLEPVIAQIRERVSGVTIAQRSQAEINTALTTLGIPISSGEGSSGSDDIDL